MSIVVRFAPAPTRLLTVTDARMALLNWLFAAQFDGTFLLRLDDIVTDSTAAEFAIGIERDLLWLGLKWAEFARQSERQDRHREALEDLRADGRVYADRDNPRVWRFRIDSREMVWDDLLQGRQAVDMTGFDDPVVVREDGTVLRALSAVVDDIEYFVSHVIRSEDRLADTALQMQVFAALGADAPRFGHLPPLVAAGAAAGDPTIESLRAAGFEAMAVNSLLVDLGRQHGVTPRHHPEDLLDGFELTAYGGPVPPFEPARLREINAALLRSLPFGQVEKRLAALGLEMAGEGFWRAVRPHLDTFNRAAEWYRVCFAEVPAVIEDLDLVLAARDVMPAEPWGEGTWQEWLDAAAARTGASPAPLARSIRLALTGRDSGPGMDTLLPLIGRERALARLGG